MILCFSPRRVVLNSLKRGLYTVLRARTQTGPGIPGIAVVMIHRKGAFTLRQGLKKLEPYELFECAVILMAEDAPDPPEDLLQLYPWVHFIICTDGGRSGTGSLLNAAAGELASDYLFVFWDDMTVIAGPDPRLLRWLEVHKPLCAAPVLTADSEILPVLHVPVETGAVMTVWTFRPLHDRTPDLFPFDFCGVYDRTALQRLGGFCSEFSGSYWQLADFGMRAWMGRWQILSCNGIVIAYDGDVHCPDTSENEDYALFLTRNTSFTCNEGRIRVRGRAAGRRISRARREDIRELQHWARCDWRTLIRRWPTPEADQ
jgi:hypothetical protein